MRFVIYLCLNFGALALGAFLMGGSPAENQWYIHLNKAPWTPPGYMFGLAWTTIMIFYSFYMARIDRTAEKSKVFHIRILFVVQWVLNVLWNPLFFDLHWVFFGAIVILLLISTLLAKHFYVTKQKSLTFLLAFPYVFWLCIALSLNLFVWIKN